MSRVILFLTLILLAKSLIVFKSFPLSFTCLSQDYNNFFLPFEASEHKHHVFYILFSFVLSLGKLFRNSDLSLISLLKVNKSRYISLFVVKKLFSIDYVNISTDDVIIFLFSIFFNRFCLEEKCGYPKLLIWWFINFNSLEMNLEWLALKYFFIGACKFKMSIKMLVKIS